MSDHSSDEGEEIFDEEEEEFEEDSDYEHNKASSKGGKRSRSSQSSCDTKNASTKSSNKMNKKQKLNIPDVFAIRDKRQAGFKAVYEWEGKKEVLKRYRFQDLNICFNENIASANSGHWPLQAGIREVAANALDAVILAADPDFIGDKVPEFKGNIFYFYLGFILLLLILHHTCRTQLLPRRVTCCGSTPKSERVHCGQSHCPSY